MRPLTQQLPRRAWIPAAVTGANIAVGFTAILTAASGRYDAAVYLLVLAIFLDMMDGRLARRLRVTSLFGKQLDSFCDVLSFGAAPAFLVYQAVLRSLGPLGVAAALVFLLAGVYRLARFNLFADEHVKARRTCGLPIPIGAGYLMVLTLMRERLDPLVSVAVVLVMSVLMVSRLRLPDLKGANAVSAMLVVGIFSYLALVAWPNWYTVSWWNLWNGLILLAARGEDRRGGVEAASSES